MAETSPKGLLDHLEIKMSLYLIIQGIIGLIIFADFVNDLFMPKLSFFIVDAIGITVWIVALSLALRGTLHRIQSFGLIAILLGLLICTEPLLIFLGYGGDNNSFILIINILCSVILVTGGGLIFGKQAVLLGTTLNVVIVTLGFRYYYAKEYIVPYVLLLAIFTIFTYVVFNFRKVLEELYEKKEKERLATVQALEELKAVKFKINNQVKLSSLSSLAAGIAHELKNP